MTAKVDGAAWDGTTLSSAVINSGTLVISGSVGIKSIVIFLIGGTAAGTYDLSNFASGASASYSGGTTAADAYSANPASGSGTVVISKINTTEVEGTFSFIGQNSSGGAKTVTEGKFSLKF
ncbi:MAG: hypothetical protein HQ472_06460 [Ignavibacteria bacterium]|nr:hypothetical protein [Ignavibacteria bacterium]